MVNIINVATNVGVNSDSTELIAVSHLPTDLKQKIIASGVCAGGRCFNNAWDIVNDVIPNAEYVLALGTLVLPTEHAIIFLDGKYYDPTWEIHVGELGKEYLMVMKWTKTNLIKHSESQKRQLGGIYPPMIKNLTISKGH